MDNRGKGQSPVAPVVQLHKTEPISSLQRCVFSGFDSSKSKRVPQDEVISNNTVLLHHLEGPGSQMQLCYHLPGSPAPYPVCTLPNGNKYLGWALLELILGVSR